MNQEQHLQRLREAGKVLASTLVHTRRSTKAGMSTEDLNTIVSKAIEEAGMRPAFLGYRGFPKSVCTSINTEIAHGIPSPKRILKEGDLLNIDIGIEHEGAYVDAGMSYGIGEIAEENRQFLENLQGVLFSLVESGILRDGCRIGDIGAFVQKGIESPGYAVVKELAGHGVGRALHEDPRIPNYGVARTGHTLRAGDVIAIEPIASMHGNGRIRTEIDQWTLSSVQGVLSGQFEFTILILEEGCEVLTPWDDLLTPEERRHYS